MTRDTTRQWLVVIAVVLTIAVNALANILPFNNLTTAEISDRYKVLFTPAGYVFSIWGLIYLGLAGFAIYQALPAQRANPRLRRIGVLFLVSSLANMSWLLLWHYLFIPYTIVAMLLILLSLMGIYQRLGIGRGQVGAGEKWLVRVPFSIYLGWITVASIVNVAVLLTFWGWSGWGISPEAWTVIMIAVALGVAAVVTIRRKDIAYALVLAWAFAGIAVEQADVPSVATAAWTAGALAVLVMGLGRLLIRPSAHR